MKVWFLRIGIAGLSSGACEASDGSYEETYETRSKRSDERYSIDSGDYGEVSWYEREQRNGASPSSQLL
jgi:hypothetical protein